MELVIGVAGEGERREARDFDVDAELFGKLADERSFGHLTVVHLAARKFP